jgi:ER membrane protein complex subunit 1, C-terminal
VRWFSAPRGSGTLAGRDGGVLSWEARLPFGGRVLAVAGARARDAFGYAPRAVAVRVTGERKLLWKFMDPSVALVLSANAEDPAAKFLSGISATLVDTKTGSVLDAVRHPGASEPVAAVRCDNWFVYTFWNADLLEQEVHVVDIYEGLPRPPWIRRALVAYASTLARGLLPAPLAETLFAATSGNSGALSQTCAAGGDAGDDVCAAPAAARGNWPPVSLAPPSLIRSSFLMSHAVTSLGVTVSERGETDRGVVFGLASGRVVQLPRMVLDPRRPQQESAASANEMLAPYRPNLAAWPTTANSRTYAIQGQAVAGLLADGGLLTSPMHGRESTCHFVALGMDIVYSTLAPAGKFDTLSDNFNYAAVVGSVSLLALSVAFTRRAAKRKLLEDQWVR